MTGRVKNYWEEEKGKTPECKNQKVRWHNYKDLGLKTEGWWSFKKKTKKKEKRWMLICNIPLWMLYQANEVTVI